MASKTQGACLWGLVKPYQVHAPAEMLEVGGRGDAVGLLKWCGFLSLRAKGDFLKRKGLVCCGLVKPCQVRAPAEMLEVGEEGEPLELFLVLAIRT
ncbi:hypothetical protein [Bartonella sp. AP21QHHD]|uniref:hypothetical protein n=1 Tax=Bartonella sp. AP21QHHD TaxID=3243477 RepID=UPI0035D05786